MLINLLAQTASEGWFEKIDRLSGQAQNTGKALGIVIAIFLIVIAAVIGRTLGKILVALVVAGVIVYGIANVVDLGETTKKTIEMNAPSFAPSIPAQSGSW